MSDRLQEFEVSNALLNNIPALRERLEEKGYLFFRDVLDKEALLAIRRGMLELAAGHGWVREGTDPIEGIYSGSVQEPGKFETTRLYREILDLATFNAFGRNPVLMLLYSGLFGAEALEHRRRIGRITTPQSFKQTTPAHQDFYYIRGTQATYTNWIPTGHCPRELGGLAVLEGSNHLGFLEHVPMSGTGGRGIPQEETDRSGLRWLTTDFALGDLLLFHSLTVHKALHNTTQEQLRVSLEYRIQPSGDAIDPGSQTYHMRGAFGENEIL
ncbi:MAG: phytanoyl-CoA dioxygenase family protein [Paenibacillaceae bacterium]|nr:phytanoyl-CoA dioxygenase family protein [Paenibacillaceae bacterium]